MAATNVTAQPNTTQTNARTGSTTNTPTSPTTPAVATPVNPLDTWLAGFLPGTIDFQDIAIRVGLVLLGTVLLILVAWAFVRGKQSTTVNVQVPREAGRGEESEAEEAAEGMA